MSSKKSDKNSEAIFAMYCLAWTFFSIGAGCMWSAAVGWLVAGGFATFPFTVLVIEEVSRREAP